MHPLKSLKTLKLLKKTASMQFNAYLRPDSTYIFAPTLNILNCDNWWAKGMEKGGKLENT